ncbi:hypothetical protein [Persicitalea jodogahamensis]|uniref:Uncharacterized protein n=1 Tax=Persicitalea jodogahamensis TaxID=402147 RepID=A0A8J3D8Z8_9BACT|nr:hypothetical protein [Persicitalea jodogahamensis]GHB77759.1 hypothetical protein GCM10007390_34920 [Persicitalea jodogahamensis]
MINSYDDLKAQRAKAHNDLQLAKSQLDADQREWKEEAKPLAIVSSVAKKMVKSKTGKKGPVGMGLQMGINAVLARTVLKKLPFPFNLFVPHMAQNLAFNYTDKYGREVLIKALHWIKDVTEEDEEIPETTELVLVESTIPPVLVEPPVETLPTPVEDQPVPNAVSDTYPPSDMIPPVN